MRFIFAALVLGATLVGLVRTSDPAVEPLSTDEARAHLHVDHGHENTLLDAYVAAARQEAERVSWRALITQTWQLTLDRFPGSRAAIRLPRPPLQSVTSVVYTDEGGSQQTLATSQYDVDTAGEPGRIVPAFDRCWPSTRRVANAVVITYVAGYGDSAADVPQAIRHWLRLFVDHAHRFRGSHVPDDVFRQPHLDALLDPVRDERLSHVL
ncbi:MAG: hypothetical protein AAFZ07_20180 [Actinomycetota bacterium]